MRFMRKLGEEGGFSLAEILVAVSILSLALLPLTGMFDAAFKGIMTFEGVRKNVECAKAAMERVRSMPFYEPYNAAFGNVDIDDHFWGTRNPVNSNPGVIAPDGTSVPNWEVIPEGALFGYGGFAGYASYRVGVQLAYLNSDTGVAVMKSDWGPKTIGKDRPTDADNRMIELLMVRVNVYWRTGGGEGKYSVDTVVTDTEAIYDMGISNITVLGPASIMSPTRTNAAAHWSPTPATIQVRIEGWGFDPAPAANLNASLVRDRNNDIPITISSKTETVILGTLVLHNTGTDIPSEPDWFPRAAVGYWSVRVNQRAILSTYLYQGFVVEYPKPVISDFFNVSDNLKTGPNFWNAVSIRVVGGPFCFQVKDPAVRLIRYGPNNEILNQIDGTVTAKTAPANTNGYAASPNCTLTATFDFTRAAPGEYKMQVVNTDEPTLVGHVASDHIAPVYVITEVVPVVTDAYVAGTSPRERRAYHNAGNPWRLVIEGSFFNMVGTPPVEVWLCSEVAGGLPAGNRAQGTVMSVVNNNNIVADFNFSALPPGDYKIYVKNLSNGAAGWTAGSPFKLLTFSGSLTDFLATTAELFWENYYDIPSRIEGTGLSGATRVTIYSPTGTPTEHDITSECTLGNDTQIPVNLNLIECSSARAWRVRVYFLAGYYLERIFTVALGPAVIVPANAFGDTRAAIYIDRGSSASPRYSYETGITGDLRAKARSNNSATFYVRGEGFPMSGNGSTRLTLYRSGQTSRTADLACTMDRASKIVRISSSFSMWNTTGDCGISVQRVTSGGAPVPPADAHDTRWRLLSTW